MFKTRKHKTFNYQPRFSKENQDVSVLEDNNNSKEFISKWKEIRGNRPKSKGFLPIRTLMLVLVLLLICMYLLEKKHM